jgi:hypothetical protein
LGGNNGEGYDFVYPCTNVHEVVYVDYDLCVRMDSDGLTGGGLSTSGEKGDGDVVYHALRDWHCIQDGMVWYQDPGHYIPSYRR